MVWFGALPCDFHLSLGIFSRLVKQLLYHLVDTYPFSPTAELSLAINIGSLNDFPPRKITKDPRSDGETLKCPSQDSIFIARCCYCCSSIKSGGS